MIKFLKRLFRREHVVTKIQVVLRDRSQLTMREFRSQPDLVGRARNILDNPDLRLMLDVLRTESPANDVYSEQVPPEWRATVHARIEGYGLAIRNLEALGIFDAPAGEDPQPTYEKPEEMVLPDNPRPRIKPWTPLPQQPTIEPPEIPV